jgi:histidinol dehydrogenase
VPPERGPLRLDTSAPDFEKEFSAFLGRNRDTDENVDRIAADIVADVRARGDAAVLEYTRKFDKVETDAAGLRLSDAERQAAAAQVPAAQRAALAFAAQRIEAFHRALLPKDVDFTDAPGTRLAARYRPLDSVGVYVPGGRSPIRPSVLMNIVPAKVAGVGRIVMVVPTRAVSSIRWSCWRPESSRRPLRVWRIGGARAVAGHGTQSIKPVDKIPARATLSPPPSAASSARSASTLSQARRRSWSWPTLRTIRRGSRPTFYRKLSTMPPRSRY